MSEFAGKEYQDPGFTLNTNDIELQCSPENTTLFVYRKLGDAAIKRFSHLFYYDETADIRARGWLNERSQEEIDLLTLALLANGYTVVQSDEVAECDIQAYERQIIQPLLEDLADYHFPESFFEDGAA